MPTNTMPNQTYFLPLPDREKLLFAEQVLEIIYDHQNVGSSRETRPFVDMEEAFAQIALFAKKELMITNPRNGLLVAKYAQECIR